MGYGVSAYPSITTEPFSASTLQPQNITDPDGNTTDKTYDSRGNLTEQVDGEGNVTQTSYNAFDQQTQVIDPATSEMQTAVYDVNGNKCWSYLGRLPTPPLSCGQPVSGATIYTYNASNDELTSMTDAPTVELPATTTTPLATRRRSRTMLPMKLPSLTTLTDWLQRPYYRTETLWGASCDLYDFNCVLSERRHLLELSREFLQMAVRLRQARLRSQHTTRTATWIPRLIHPGT